MILLSRKMVPAPSASSGGWAGSGVVVPKNSSLKLGIPSGTVVPPHRENWLAPLLLCWQLQSKVEVQGVTPQSKTFKAPSQTKSPSPKATAPQAEGEGMV